MKAGDTMQTIVLASDHGGFTLKTIVQAVRAAGFRSVAGRRREDQLDLWLLACPSLLDVPAIESLVAAHFPE
jgi:hypothetical protein